jgi:hypothetical protein
MFTTVRRRAGESLLVAVGVLMAVSVAAGALLLEAL